LKPERREPEIIYQVQGQLPRLKDAVAADEADPESGIRERFASPTEIEQIFWEASQKR
jgi:hypothetical protein